MESELAAIVTEFDCSKTLETGLGRGGSALATATVHEQRGRGGHTAIDPHQESVFSSDGLERLRRAGLLHRVQFIASPSEVALPELLRDGIEIDFALIHGPKRFEDAFVEFLYLDRMLVTGGIMALAGAEERAVAAVLEFVAQARAYELRSDTGPELAVLRKLGRQRTQEPPFPSGWGLPGERGGRDRNLASENGGVAGGVADLPRAAGTNGTTLKAPSTRELHLARTRAGELEARVAELGARLLDAEQRSAELLHTRARLGEVELERQRAQGEIGELRSQLSLSEAAHHRAEHWLACVNSSASGL
jgi:Methyltransferase domain